MDTDFFFYLLHWVFVIGALMFSWARSRHYLHPHFLFTIILVVLLSDFLMRGYDDTNLYNIPQSDVHQYQFIILVILTLIVFATSLVRSPRLERSVRQISLMMNPNRRTQLLMYIIVFVLLGAELIKRFVAVDWSLDEVVMQSLMPRGQSAWDQAGNTGNFIFAIISTLLPFSALLLAYLSVGPRGSKKLFPLLGFAFVVVLLVLNGSRTPVAIALAALTFFWMQGQRIGMRMVTLGVTLSVASAIFSAMYLYRSSGYMDTIYGTSNRDFELVYHQDDSYYRSISAYYQADKTDERWDPVFFITTIVVNPIPRAVWPSKPLFTPEFYGNFKLDYVTTSFLGEVVAMTGVNLSLVVGLVVGHCIYLLLFNSLRLFKYPAGATAYILSVVYVYMVVRSLPNLTQFIYLPAFAAVIIIFMSMLLKRRARLTTKRLAS